MRLKLLICIAILYLDFVLGNVTEENTESGRSNEDNYNLGMISTEKNAAMKTEEKEYEAEKKLGDMADFFGTNQHKAYPDTYNDLGRRFVLQYPYKDVSNTNEDEEVETDFNNIFVKELRDENLAENHLMPVKAPPELVLAVAAKAALLEADNPRNAFEEKNNYNKLLRSGNYWNNVWREDVDPSILRTQKNVVNPVKIKIMPESKLYNLVSELKKMSPKLVYVINRK